MEAEQWFRDLLGADENDPDALTEDLVLDVTEQLYRRMQERGMRPSELAKRLGVSRAFVSQLLNGKSNMTLRTLVGVAFALSLRIRIEFQPKDATAKPENAPSIGAQTSRIGRPERVLDAVRRYSLSRDQEQLIWQTATALSAKDLEALAEAGVLPTDAVAEIVDVKPVSLDQTAPAPGGDA